MRQRKRRKVGVRHDERVLAASERSKTHSSRSNKKQRMTCRDPRKLQHDQYLWTRLELKRKKRFTLHFISEKMAPHAWIARRPASPTGTSVCWCGRKVYFGGMSNNSVTVRRSSRSFLTSISQTQLCSFTNAHCLTLMKRLPSKADLGQTWAQYNGS